MHIQQHIETQIGVPINLKQLLSVSAEWNEGKVLECCIVFIMLSLYLPNDFGQDLALIR